jgi:hypothetical protein
METFDSFTIRPQTLKPETWRPGEPGQVGAYQIKLYTLNTSNVDYFGIIILDGPLTIRDEPGHVKKNLEGYAFGKSAFSWNSSFISNFKGRQPRYYGVLTILYGEADNDPAKLYHYTYNIFEYTTTTKIAKNIIEALEKHTLIRAVTEVTTAPRRAIGPAAQDGRVPRDPTFERLPNVGKIIRSFLGGKTRKQKKKASRRRKTLARRR